MKPLITVLLLLVGSISAVPVFGQDAEQKIVDVVWLRDGSKLSGTILKWEYERGMEFQLTTGAVVALAKKDILRVYQDVPFSPQQSYDRRTYVKAEKVYNFKEEGIYHTFSVFLNFSEMGGAGMHYSIGHRFSRLLGVGIGTGLESHDFFTVRNIVPVYAEARGYFLKQKITPYYALKIGYGFALKDELGGTIETKGGFHFSPELGVRFGASSVSYYLGMEYKLQNASFTTEGWDGNGQGTFTEAVSYRRVEMRTGLVF